MAEESFAERTEQATPRRREEARKRGQVAKSREIPSVAILLSGISLIFITGSYFYRHLSGEMVSLLSYLGRPPLGPAEVESLNIKLIRSLFFILSPVFLTVLGISILSHQAQSQFLFSAEPLRLDWSKVNPIIGLKRIVSKQSLVELIKSILKFIIIGGVAYFVIKKEVSSILSLVDQEICQIFSYIRSIAWNLLLKVFSLMMGLAVLDYLFQRWSFERSLRMTKQELKEEMKLTEGDPLIKSRVRSLQRQLARRRMMAEVPKADVVITNPTHIAIALYYHPKEMEAPKVIAKGAGWIAEKIVMIAHSHQIPIVENKPLAQILYRSVELGQIIPPTLYQAVADILAYVYRIKKKVW
ncbi:MAG: flagellar biosynthesis protein FlhB [Candidatus Anstonellales archaeon]